MQSGVPIQPKVRANLFQPKRLALLTLPPTDPGPHSAQDMQHEPSPAPEDRPAEGTYCTLTLIRKKDGSEISRYPVDGEVTSFGRSVREPSFLLVFSLCPCPPTLTTKRICSLVSLSAFLLSLCLLGTSLTT